MIRKMCDYALDGTFYKIANELIWSAETLNFFKSTLWTI